MELCSDWVGAGFGGEWIHVYIYMAEILYCPPETITTLLIGYQFSSVQSLSRV